MPYRYQTCKTITTEIPKTEQQIFRSEVSVQLRNVYQLKESYFGPIKLNIPKINENRFYRHRNLAWYKCYN
jgi:hypothetical protein